MPLDLLDGKGALNNEQTKESLLVYSFPIILSNFQPNSLGIWNFPINKKCDTPSV